MPWSKSGAKRRSGHIKSPFFELLGARPVDETAHRALMSVYARKHRYALALRQYQLCREVLNRELGVEPEMETRQLHSDIIKRRPKSAGQQLRPCQA